MDLWIEQLCENLFSKMRLQGGSLETILHPKVRKECLEKLDFYSKTMSTTLFVADVPLLFESGFDFGQELNLVVATSQATQRTRLKARNHFEDRMISSILKAQLPIREKGCQSGCRFLE
jgi:dephospho-CoA kinase